MNKSTDLDQLYKSIMPFDADDALLVGRVWHDQDRVPGVSPVRITADGIFDLSELAPTCSELMNMPDAAKRILAFGEKRKLGETKEVLLSSLQQGNTRFLSPIDLQAIKACGVTFVKSMLERVIEEKAGGDKSLAMGIRKTLSDAIGRDISQVVPGSDAAEQLKEALQKNGLWSQYLEVGIGPDAEVFTKAPVLSSVGLGAEIGIHPKSSWNNPEPEAVLIINGKAEIVGASLGNDVNLRDVEGRSALLLGKAKDNNASAAIGPFIRLFDEKFTLDHVRQEDIHLQINHEDGFSLSDVSSMGEISRDVTDLVGQAINENHQYPDGIALYLGTMFAPTKDRGLPGSGFTHKVGDQVHISSVHLGRLSNIVNYSDKAPPWQFGIHALFKNLADRGHLG
ncbi:MAG: fumarylacetoacetate hydrolase family protein [Sneathiella sp.]